MRALRDQAEAPAELEPQRAERLGGGPRLVGDEQQQVALGRRRAAAMTAACCSAREELRDRRAPAAVLDERVRDRLAAVALDDLVEPVELRARHLARAGVERAHRAAAAEDRLEHLELRAAQRVGDVGELEAEAAVGTVRAEAEHRLVVGHPRPRRRRQRRSRSPANTACMTASVTSRTSSSSTKRHLDVELGELGLAVGAQVLVAEAAGDLVVALVAAHHQQLLEQLRRLRQRVPRARLQPRGHEEVARALGRRAGEDRRLDVEEVALVEHAGASCGRRVSRSSSASCIRSRRRSSMRCLRRSVSSTVDVLVDRERRRLGRSRAAAASGRGSRSRPSRGSG